MQIIKSLYKSISGRIEGLVHGFGTPTTDCVVLCLHSTPRAYFPQFQTIVARLQKHFTVIGPGQFESYMRGELAQGPYLLFTFDDGVKNNFYTAQWLHSQGIGAYFFVVPDFITSADPKAYYLQYIRPIVDNQFENAAEDFQSMSIADLKQLVAWGHAIGSHTMSHTLHNTMPEPSAHREIINSKQWLEDALQQAVTSFCSPNNTAWSIGTWGKKQIATHYPLHFTTFPGHQVLPPNGQMIMRRNIEINWSWPRIQFALGQWDLKRWRTTIQAYEAL